MKLRAGSFTFVFSAGLAVSAFSTTSHGFEQCRNLFVSSTKSFYASLRQAAAGETLPYKFDVVTNSASVSTVLPDGRGGFRTLFSVLAEPGHRVQDVERLSPTEAIVEYVSDPVYYSKNPTPGTFSLQILGIGADGTITGLQKFDATATARTGLRRVLDENTFVAERRYTELNRGSDALVYRRNDAGRFEVAGRLNNVEFDVLGTSAKDAGVHYVAVRAGHFNKEEALYRFVPGAAKPELILSGGQTPRRPGHEESNEPNRIYRLAGDIFGRGLTASYSANLREIEVFVPTKSGKMKFVGTVESTQRDLRGYDRTSKEVRATSFAVLDNHSYTSGIAEFVNYHREMDLTIVGVANGKLSRQVLQLNDSFKVGTPDAVGLKLEVLDPKQLLLVGRGYVQVVRAPVSKFGLAEVVRFTEFAEAPLKGDRIEIVRISETRFIIQDLYVLERGAEHDLSQIHVFDKIDGAYQYTGRRLLDGRRIGNTTVLPDGRLWVDVRNASDTATPRPRIIDLNQAQ